MESSQPDAGAVATQINTIANGNTPQITTPTTTKESETVPQTSPVVQQQQQQTEETSTIDPKVNTNQNDNNNDNSTAVVGVAADLQTTEEKPGQQSLAQLQSQPQPQQPQQQSGDEPSESVDAELEAMKKRLQQMEQETMAMQGGADESGTNLPDGVNPGIIDPNNPMGMQPGVAMTSPTGSSSGLGMTIGPGGIPHAANSFAPGLAIDDPTADSDLRSIYVGNVDYNATGEELNEFFKQCGTINRVTIMSNKITGHPKGYAYIEFKERESVQNALILNESVFHGRQLKVLEKRKNIPGMARGGMARGRARFTRGWRAGSFRGRPRGGGRGRGRGRWAPY